MEWLKILKKRWIKTHSQSAGFEPALPEGIWFLVRRLNHSATTAHDVSKVSRQCHFEPRYRGRGRLCQGRQWVNLCQQARLAQSVEHETLNLRVMGSSPMLGASFCCVEHQSGVTSNTNFGCKTCEAKSWTRFMKTSNRFSFLLINLMSKYLSIRPYDTHNTNVVLSIFIHHKLRLG